MNLEEKLRFIKLLDALTDAMGDSDDQSTDEIREELHEEGFDIDAAEDRFLEFQKEISMAAKRQALDEAKIRREKSQSLSQVVKGKIARWSREQILERFKEIASTNPELAIFYRDLEARKDEDIRELLKDAELALLAFGDDKDGQE